MTEAATSGPDAALRMEVEEAWAGQRLDRYLASVLPDHTRSRIQRLIREGLITVESGQARPSQTVRAGDVVAIRVPPATIAATLPEDLPLDVVYQDPDLIVIDKPAGMVVHPAPGHEGGTLVNALLHHISDLSGVGGERRPGIVHRLDRGTSGLMVIAKHDSAHASLARQFHEREVEKTYVALVWGVVHAGKRIDLMIGRDP